MPKLPSAMAAHIMAKLNLSDSEYDQLPDSLPDRLFQLLEKSDSKYNGWTNYETWAVNLWLDNDEVSQKYWRARAKQAFKAAAAPSANAKLTGREPFTRKERAALLLDDWLKEEHEAALPDSSEMAGFAADLLNAAMSEVNWHEIAERLLEA